MFCRFCGKEIEDSSIFCRECGSNVTNNTPHVEMPLKEQPPISEAGTVTTATNMHYMPEDPIPAPTPSYLYEPPLKPKKKKTYGLRVFLIALLLIVSSVLYVFGTVSWFPPNNLGVKYTQADFNTAIRKLGIHIKANFGNGDSYDTAEILSGSDTATGYLPSVSKNRDLSYKDYNWQFSNYQTKNVSLTQEEATALLNGLLNNYGSFKKIQVKFSADNTIYTSSRVNIAKLKRDLYSDVADKIPFLLPDKANLYTEGRLSISNNRLSMTPKTIKGGVLSLPDEYKTGPNLVVFASYLERLYSIIPGLQVNSVSVINGKLNFIGNVPTEVLITPKSE